MTVNDFLYLLDDNGTVPVLVPVRFCVNSIHIDADSQPRVEILHFYYTVPSLLNIDRSPRLQNFQLLISVLPTIPSSSAQPQSDRRTRSRTPSPPDQ